MTSIGTCYLTPSPSFPGNHIAEMLTHEDYFVSCLVKKGQTVHDAFREAADNVTWCICSSQNREAPCTVQARALGALNKLKIIPTNPSTIL